MTTTMTTALQEAGITLPVNRRIWMWLKDHPRLAAGDLAKTLGIDNQKASAGLDDLYRRSMVVRDSEMRRFKAGGKAKGLGTIERPVYVYTVNPKMRGTWEMWPMPKKDAPSVKTKAARFVATLGVSQAALVKPAVAPPTLPWTPEVAVEKLTLTQCRELFNYLHKVFKE